MHRMRSTSLSSVVSPTERIGIHWLLPIQSRRFLPVVAKTAATATAIRPAEPE